MAPKSTKKKKKKKKKAVSLRKVCPFCKEKIKDIDYKDVNRLSRFLNEKGKIVSRRTTGVCAKHQRRLAQAIKRARFLSLLPYVKI